VRCSLISFLTDHHVSCGSGIGRRVRLWQLGRWLPRSAGEQERQRQADPGQHGAGQEGGLVALSQRGERVRAFVRCQVVLGAETATVVTMATPSAVPGCKAVLLRAEASPASCSATPASAAPVAFTKARPIPGPHKSSPTKTSGK